jgi:hypothetical protein
MRWRMSLSLNALLAQGKRKKRLLEEVRDVDGF